MQRWGNPGYPSNLPRHISALFDENGKIKDNGTVQFLQTFVHAFVDLIKKYQA
jgi:chromate reductase, NAD(P)H dehydrogenase (quinone)